MQKFTCTLPAELNPCEHFNPDGSLCRNASPDNKCGMLIVEDDQRKTDEYHRAPRWYEKYYK